MVPKALLAAFDVGDRVHVDEVKVIPGVRDLDEGRAVFEHLGDLSEAHADADLLRAGQLDYRNRVGHERGD